jgi:hypothetical protein
MKSFISRLTFAATALAAAVFIPSCKDGDCKDYSVGESTVVNPGDCYQEGNSDKQCLPAGSTHALKLTCQGLPGARCHLCVWRGESKSSSGLSASALTEDNGNDVSSDNTPKCDTCKTTHDNESSAFTKEEVDLN